MANYDEASLRCPACGAGAHWTSPIETDEQNGALRLLFCGECGTYLGEQRAWHDLGPGQDGDDDADADVRTRHWLERILVS